MNKLLFLLVSFFLAFPLGCRGGVSVFGSGGNTTFDDGGAGGTGAGGTGAGGTGGTQELCCTDCEYPAYLFDKLELRTMLEDPSYNDFLNDLLVDAVPPNGNDVILLFDPKTELEGLSSFDAAFGRGMATEDLWSWDPGGNPADLSYTIDDQGNFISTDPDLTLQLAFGVTVPLHQAYISGQLAQGWRGWQNISSGAITGAILEGDTEGVETSFGNLHDLMDGRPLDVDVDGDSVPDAWSFEMNFTAFQFVAEPTR